MRKIFRNFLLLIPLFAALPPLALQAAPPGTFLPLLALALALLADALCGIVNIPTDFSH